ncbi:hypothetical protein MCEMKE157_01050 [actinobacterium SCGC AAA044-D11]
MRKIVLVLTLTISVLVPTGAQAAQTKFVGGPLTNLAPQGAVINAQLSEVPTRAGLYMQQCVESAAGARPTLCNEAAQLWISTAQGASFAPTAAIQFKPAASFISGTTTIDCTVSKCGIFLRFDHTAGPNFSEDQFIPITFKSGTAATVVLPADEITATINGVAVSTRTPITLGYRQIAKVDAVSKAGAALTYASLSPNCGLNGKEITPLKGSGECAISVTSAATATATAILPIRLTLGVQTIPVIAAKKSVKLATVTNFGEKVSYQAGGSCSVKKSVLTAKKGKCTVNASAAGQDGLFEALKQKVVLRIK